MHGPWVRGPGNSTALSAPARPCAARVQAAVNAAAVEAPPQAQLDWETLAAEMDSKSPLEIMDHVGAG